MAMTAPEGWTVKAQCNHATRSLRRPRSSDRWGYVITPPPDRPVYVSSYRWHTEAAALVAGEADARQCAELEEQWAKDRGQA
jgi:hypothetical protein